MIVALDLAGKTGLAWWRPGMDKPRSQVIELPSGEHADGAAYSKLHRTLIDLHRVEGEVERIYFERPLATSHFGGQSNFRTAGRLTGLVAHVDSFAHAVGANAYHVALSSWRKHFLGKGTQESTTAFKAAAMERCRQLGWTPKDHNAADALGILDYALHLLEIKPPWRDDALMLGSPFRRRG